MNKDSELILKMMKQYGLNDPVLKDEIKIVEASRERTIKVNIKRAGKYGLFAALYLSIHFLCKKIGISVLTFNIIVSSTIAGGIGSYIVIKQIIDKDIIKADEKLIERKEEVKVQIIYKVGFKPFHSLDESIPPTFINQISNKIINECNKRKGTNFAGMISSEKNYRYVARGEIIKYENKIRIFIRTGETKTTLSKFYIKEEGDIEKLDEICSKVAEKFITNYESLNK